MLYIYYSMQAILSPAYFLNEYGISRLMFGSHYLKFPTQVPVALHHIVSSNIILYVDT